MSEKKYKIKPIDLAGCHEAITNCIRQGESILCKVNPIYNNNQEDYISTYKVESDHPYESIHYAYSSAEPVEIKTTYRKKKASEIVKWLEDNGYKWGVKLSLWVKPGKADVGHNCNIFEGCGEITGKPSPIFPDDWYEEVEI